MALYHIKAETKRFTRTLIYFLYFDSNITEVGVPTSNDSGLARRKAIIWTHDAIIHWRTHTPLGPDGAFVHLRFHVNDKYKMILIVINMISKEKWDLIYLVHILQHSKLR